MKAYTITLKGQVTIPTEIREKMKLKPGDKITYEDTAAGIFLRAVKMDMMADFGFMKGQEKPADIETIRKSIRQKLGQKIH